MMMCRERLSQHSLKALVIKTMMVRVLLVLAYVKLRNSAEICVCMNKVFPD